MLTRDELQAALAADASAFPPCESCGVPAATIHAPGCAQVLAFENEMQDEDDVH